jgi:pantoate--beta-alanine ligase
MVRDQNLPVEIVAGPIVREPEGLAMSSRNAYLDAQQRQQALVLSRTLKRIAEVFQKGERSTARLLAAGREVFSAQPAVRLDYLAAVDPETLEPVDSIARDTLVAVAAYMGTTRLIDNTVLKANSKQ